MGLTDIDVLTPSTPEEAIRDFGDGAGVTVVGGGTILMPDLLAARVRPKRALLLSRSGLKGVTRQNGTVTIGAMTPVSALEDGDEPLATAAQYVADLEIRAQGTVGGNLCATSSPERPRGDLQAPLIVLDARVRSAAKGGERTEPVEDFLSGGGGRLVLDVSYDDVPRQVGYAAAWRPHAFHYTILAVAAAKRDGELRVAATGLTPRAVRLSAVEQGGSATDALSGLELREDTLASAWYRAKLLPGLVEQALSKLEEAG